MAEVGGDADGVAASAAPHTQTASPGRTDATATMSSPGGLGLMGPPLTPVRALAAPTAARRLCVESPAGGTPPKAVSPRYRSQDEFQELDQSACWIERPIAKRRRSNNPSNSSSNNDIITVAPKGSAGNAVGRSAVGKNLQRGFQQREAGSSRAADAASVFQAVAGGGNDTDAAFYADDDDATEAMQVDPGGGAEEALPPPPPPRHADCRICFQPVYNKGRHKLVVLTCGHMFGLSCAETHWKLRKTSQKMAPCPSCQQLVPAKFQHVIADSLIQAHDRELQDKVEKQRSMLLQTKSELRRTGQLAVRVARERDTATTEAARLAHELAVSRHEVKQLREHCTLLRTALASAAPQHAALSMSSVPAAAAAAPAAAAASATTPAWPWQCVDVDHARICAVSGVFPHPILMSLKDRTRLGLVQGSSPNSVQMLPQTYDNITDIAWAPGCFLAAHRGGVDVYNDDDDGQLVRTVCLATPAAACSCACDSRSPRRVFAGLVTGVVAVFSLVHVDAPTHLLSLHLPRRVHSLVYLDAEAVSRSVCRATAATRACDAGVGADSDWRTVDTSGTGDDNDASVSAGGAFDTAGATPATERGTINAADDSVAPTIASNVDVAEPAPDVRPIHTDSTEAREPSTHGYLLVGTFTQVSLLRVPPPPAASPGPLPAPEPVPVTDVSTLNLLGMCASVTWHPDLAMGVASYRRVTDGSNSGSKEGAEVAFALSPVDYAPTVIRRIRIHPPSIQICRATLWRDPSCSTPAIVHSAPSVNAAVVVPAEGSAVSSTILLGPHASCVLAVCAFPGHLAMLSASRLTVYDTRAGVTPAQD